MLLQVDQRKHFFHPTTCIELPCLNPGDFVEIGAKGKGVVMPMIDVSEAVTSSLVVCGFAMS